MPAARPAEDRILAFVLGGGEGARLRPLTQDLPKPAVPFVDGYRIVDFVLSNLLNSGVKSVYVLAQYKPRALIDHIDGAWKGRFRGCGGFVRALLPPGGSGEGFRGTADAVHRYIDLVREHAPDLVAVFAADHVYRMDVRQMAAFHRACDAEVSVAATRVPLNTASALGVIVADAQQRILAFEEKPVHPAPLPDDPGRVFASMGNYLFEPRVLVNLLERCAADGGTDFGRDVLPLLPGHVRAYAYDFAANRLPGLSSWETPGYWRDVGTPQELLAAREDVVGGQPRIDLNNPTWPIHGERRRNLRPSPQAVLDALYGDLGGPGAAAAAGPRASGHRAGGGRRASTMTSGLEDAVRMSGWLGEVAPPVDGTEDEKVGASVRNGALSVELPTSERARGNVRVIDVRAE